MRAGRVLGAGVLAMILAGCGWWGLERAEMDATLVDQSLTRFKPIEGRWNSGDAETRFTAYFDGDQLVYLRETFTAGERGVGNEYFFRTGRVFLAREGWSKATGKPPRVVRTMIWVAFDPEGEPTGSRKTIDGEEVDPTDGDLTAARRRAGDLASAAYRARDGATVQR